MNLHLLMVGAVVGLPQHPGTGQTDRPSASAPVVKKSLSFCLLYLGCGSGSPCPSQLVAVSCSWLAPGGVCSQVSAEARHNQ